MLQESMSNHAYLEKYQALINVLEAIGGNIGKNPILVSIVCHQDGLMRSILNEATITQVKKDMQE